MCGILFCLLCSNHLSREEGQTLKKITSNSNSANAGYESQLLESLLEDPVLDRRGPDVSTRHQLHFSSLNVCAWMKGCVLRLRGQTTPQPITDDKGNSLLWNGEIFGGIEVSLEDNDTQVLFQRLTACQSDEEILKTFQEVQGPWAAIYWQAEKQVLWFGRDVFGRRSLLWHLPTDSTDLFALSSVAVGDLAYTELPSVGIFALDLSSVDVRSSSADDNSTSLSTQGPAITLYPWLQCCWPGTAQSVLETPEHELTSFLAPNQPDSIIPVTVDKNHILEIWIPEMSKEISKQESSSIQDSNLNESDETLLRCLEQTYKEDDSLRMLSEKLNAVLLEAVRRRVENVPVCCPDELDSITLKDSSADSTIISPARIAVLFSGGLDSSVITALLDKCLPQDEPVDLLNVAFEQAPPSTSSNQRPKKYRKNKNSSHQQRNNSNSQEFFESDPSDNLSKKNSRVVQDLANFSSSMSNSVSSVKMTTATTPSHLCSDLTDLHLQSHNANDTHSVSLSDPSSISEPERNASESYACTPNSNITTHDPYDVPDRRTGRVAFSELNPNRPWNLIEIDVTQKELQASRTSSVARLIQPLHTVLDDSIGCAVWFASRGKGRLANHRDQPVVSKAKVILCGMAADEQFAGYSRHRAHFNQFGEESLVRQLEQEMWRISARNLGRDDRIIADHGKEARFPFLDENATQFISDIPVHRRANLSLPRGVGEKLLLRLCAWDLKLKQTACQPKRAIQFGSKIAKLDDRKEKGSDVCKRLL